MYLSAFSFYTCRLIQAEKGHDRCHKNSPEFVLICTNGSCAVAKEGFENKGAPPIFSVSFHELRKFELIEKCSGYEAARARNISGLQHLIERDQSCPNGEFNQFCAGVHVEFFHNTFAVASNGLWTELEPLANVMVVKTLSYQFQHFAFPPA